MTHSPEEKPEAKKQPSLWSRAKDFYLRKRNEVGKYAHEKHDELGDACSETFVTNFPEDADVVDILKANSLALLADVPIANLDELSDEDIERASRELKVGDVLLTGDLETLSSVAIAGPVTHVLIYVGNGKCIHSTAAGVNVVSVRKVLKKSNTAMIVRPDVPDEQKLVAVKYASSQIGKPYDYDFKEGEESFYCSELIVQAYKSAGFDFDFADNNKRINEQMPAVLQNPGAVYPISLVNVDQTEVVFVSDNIDVSGDQPVLKKDS